jgi:hypothetical protein
MAGPGSFKFEKIAKEGMRQAFSKKNIQDARNWFRQEARKTKKLDINLLLRDNPDYIRSGSMNSKLIGRMVMFFYDPKHKKTLPYYDRFPLIFPIEIYKDGFLGINLHYLSPYNRAKLLDLLYQTMNNARIEENKRLRISYQILKNAAKYRLFKPCVKRYLTAHLRSRFFVPTVEMWDYTLMLPTARWESQTGPANATQIYKQSLAASKPKVKR